MRLLDVLYFSTFWSLLFFEISELSWYGGGGLEPEKQANLVGPLYKIL